jgi:hypothetical protein
LGGFFVAFDSRTHRFDASLPSLQSRTKTIESSKVSMDRCKCDIDASMPNMESRKKTFDISKQTLQRSTKMMHARMSDLERRK